MITFGAKYLSPVNIGEIKNKKKIVPREATIVELCPGDRKDSISFNFVSFFPLRKKKYSAYMYEDFLDTKDGKRSGKNWVKYYALTKGQDSYKYVKARNILGLAEVSSLPRLSGCIYLDYLQAIKNRFFNKYTNIGTEMLKFLKSTYPDKDIVLRSLKSSVKFYKRNGFVATENGKKDGLVEMRYYRNNVNCP